VHAVFLLWTLALDILASNRGPVFVAFIDLRKAFPSIGRDALFSRMLRLGIPYPLVAAVRSFYLGNVARLRVDNCLTKDFCVAIGVLEGSVLSPFLFGVLFSAIWDFFNTTSFPSPAIRVYNYGSLWFIAYADDLAVITLSADKLGHVLNKLASELKDFNLLMRCLTQTACRYNCLLVIFVAPVFLFAVRIFVLSCVFRNICPSIDSKMDYLVCELNIFDF
jgi:hypothetical protein